MARGAYGALIRKSGISTGITNEATTIASGSSVLFQITDKTRRVIDPNTAWHVKDSATCLTYAQLSAINFVSGEITLAAPASGPTVISFSGSYLPITTSSDLLLNARDFSLTDSNDLLDVTVFTGTTDRTRSRIAGLNDVDFSVESIASRLELSQLSTLKFNSTPVVTEVYFGNASDPRFRGFCLIESIESSGNVEDLLVTNVGFKIAAQHNFGSSNPFVASYDFIITPN